ncbi:MAG TPA: hypothetical protein VGL72_06500, partial [Bryobacteraceae bacterium]
MNGSGQQPIDPSPSQPPQAQVEQSGPKLGEMNSSAAQNSSPVSEGVLPCQKKSWFAIRIVDKDDAVIEALTIKLKIPDLGDTDRITSKGTDPIKIDELAPGGKGDVRFIESENSVWE